MPKSKILPITGSWFEFQHLWKVEGKYWDKSCAQFSCEQWTKKIEEIREIGIDHLVLLDVACDSKAYFDTPLFPKFPFACNDPLEVCLGAADRLGIKFFVGIGYFTPCSSPWQKINESGEVKKRFQAMNEILEKYGHHSSFYGWYLPHEAQIKGHFREEFVTYVKMFNSEARRLFPEGKILIAPYGTRLATPDAAYMRQLEEMDLDFIAYQDEVGVEKSKSGELPGFYEGLKKAHDKLGKTGLWADVEIFRFEGAVYKSALLPASFERILKQLKAASDFVDKILVYQYQGMMNKPDTPAFAGRPDSTKLYRDYKNWLGNYI